MMIIRRPIFLLILLAAVPLWSQSDPVVASNAPSAEIAASSDDARMLTPPAISGAAYPTAPASEERSNYLRAGVTFNSAYDDNVLGGVSSHPVSDVNYSIWPTITLDQTTTRLRSLLTYAPGFTFYQRTTGRDETDQNATMDFQYRLSPHVTGSFRDSFQKSSNVFNQPDVLSDGAVNGSTQIPTAAVISPVADRLTNTGTAGLTYQFSPTSMIGAGGAFSNLHYPRPSKCLVLWIRIRAAGQLFTVAASGRNTTWACYTNIPGLRLFQLVPSSTLKLTQGFSFTAFI
jgi:hypothetical protein